MKAALRASWLVGCGCIGVAGTDSSHHFPPDLNLNPVTWDDIDDDDSDDNETDDNDVGKPPGGLLVASDMVLGLKT